MEKKSVIPIRLRLKLQGLSCIQMPIIPARCEVTP